MLTDVKNILITGTTGFMGSHFIYESLKEGNIDYYYCIARELKSESAENRVKNATLNAAKNSGEDNLEQISLLIKKKVIVIDVNFYEDDFVATVEKILSNINIHDIWHFAAFLSLANNETVSKTIFNINYNGTKNILGYAKRKEAAFNYISTAYVSGKSKEVSIEKLKDDSYDTNNPYEFYKRKSEMKISEFAEGNNLRYRIFRPSIVICHSKTGRGDTSTGFYGYITVAQRIKHEVSTKMPTYFENFPLNILVKNSNIYMNLMHIDLATHMMIEIAKSDKTLDKIFHIANPKPVHYTSCNDIINIVTNVKLSLVTDSQKMNMIDTIANEQLNNFGSYYNSNNFFDCSNGLEYSKFTAEQLKVNLDALKESSFKYFKNIHRQEKILLKKSGDFINSKMQRKYISSDSKLNYYVTGEGKETLLIINAYGQSLHFWSKLFPLLSDTYKLIIWEIRGTVGTNGGLNRVFSLNDHIQDAMKIIKEENISSYHIVGWCTGPKLAIEIASLHKERVKSISFITPAFKSNEFNKKYQTKYEKDMEPLCQLAYSNPSIATSIKDALNSIVNQKDELNLNDENNVRLNNVIDLVNKDLRSLVLAPFVNEESLINYATQLLEFWKHDIKEKLEKLELPILFLIGENDAIASSKMAYDYAKSCKKVQYFEFLGGSHYIHYEQAQAVYDVLKEFTESSEDITIDYSLFSTERYINTLETVC